MNYIFICCRYIQLVAFYKQQRSSLSNRQILERPSARDNPETEISIPKYDLTRSVLESV